MDRAEAKALLLGESAKYRTKSYAELSTLVGHPDTYEVKGASGVVYQLERQAFWDDKPNDVLRVRLAIDDGGIRAYFPMIEDFLISPDGQFVGE
jgi:hypothetical protein